MRLFIGCWKSHDVKGFFYLLSSFCINSNQCMADPISLPLRITGKMGELHPFFPSSLLTNEIKLTVAH
jgi:hypothetical protein